jgi:hypothetical protein
MQLYHACVTVGGAALLSLGRGTAADSHDR